MGHYARMTHFLVVRFQVGRSAQWTRASFPKYLGSRDWTLSSMWPPGQGLTSTGVLGGSNGTLNGALSNCNARLAWVIAGGPGTGGCQWDRRSGFFSCRATAMISRQNHAIAPALLGITDEFHPYSSLICPWTRHWKTRKTQRNEEEALYGREL